MSISMMPLIQPDSTTTIPLPGDTEYTYKSVEVTFNSDQRKRFNYRLRPSVGEFFNGQKYSLQSDFNYRIQPFFQASLKLNYDHIQLGHGFPTADLLLVSPKVDLTFTKSIFLDHLCTVQFPIRKLRD